MTLLNNGNLEDVWLPVVLAILVCLTPASMADVTCGERAPDDLIVLGYRLDTTYAETWNTENSYVMLGTIPGDFGGKLYVTQKTSCEDSWWEFGSGDDGDQGRGDPRWIERYLGVPEVEKLGFRVLPEFSGELRTSPDAVELNGRITRLNTLLDEPISLTFYTPPVEASAVEHDEYLKRFITSYELPIAAVGTEYYHDVNAHAGSLALPTAFQRFLKYRLDGLTSMRDFVAQNYPNARYFQGQGAKVVDLLSKELRGLPENAESLNTTWLYHPDVYIPFTYFGSSEYTRKEHLLWWFGKFLEHRSTRGYLHNFMSRGVSIIFQDFILEYSRTNPEVCHEIPVSAEGVFDYIEARRAKVRQALQQLTF